MTDNTANNGCYQRVYVDKNKASEDITTLAEKDTDVFGNDFYNFNKKYNRVDKDGNPKTTGVYKRCTYTPELVGGELKGVECANPTGDSISSFESPDSCSLWTEPTSRLLWKRRDKDCKEATDINPGYALPGVYTSYVARDYVRRTYGEYDSNGKWVTEIKTATCRPLTTIVEPVDPVVPEPSEPIVISDFEFAYPDGVLIARVEGPNALIEPEANTVINS